ncbi:MAG: MBL fold metallo-hydrolase [Alphaproteobacteria bacterium]|nr:MBL fold metallo-hydrolase [Alphaproteobacteria bacterium]
MKISFHGAAQGVTGSCHLLECGHTRVLIDCGFFQGSRELDEDNAEPFGFDPGEIDYLLLTHAHVDHCGRIPLLVKRGFRGEIIATAATRELARITLLDAARLEEEEFQRARRHGNRRAKPTPDPLYSTADALWCFEFFGRAARYGEWITLDDAVRVRFIDAGHILGSASIEVDAKSGQDVRRIVFSGDIGNSNRPLLENPTKPGAADYVVMETTYGDRDHKDLAASKTELYTAIAETIGRGGNVLIPTFALQRAQELLFHLREGIDQGLLPRNLPVMLDSPMAISVTGIFRRYPELFNARARELIAGGTDPCALPGLRFTRETAESIAINTIKGGAVILAGSGMCTGGRIRHHLKHNLWREKASIIFVGFAAHGTLARRIIDGAEEVPLFGEQVRVGAQVHTINGFSAHADRDELLSWLEGAGDPRLTILVHGDPDRGMDSFSSLLKDRKRVVTRPELHESVWLD